MKFLKDLSRRQKRTVIRLLISLVLLIAASLIPLDGIWKFLIFLPAYIVIGYDVVKDAVLNIVHGQLLDEKFLMTLATVGAFATGDYKEAVAVMLFYQVGELFQSIAVGKSRKSIAALMDIRPDSARVIRDGAEVTVSPDEVAIGETIVVHPGEKIPLDGTVTEGDSTVDLSALTGESVPGELRPGDRAVSGSVNLSGVIKINVEQVFGESTVSKILDLVENSSAKKAKTENFVTRFARVYTPAVVAGAVLLAFLPPLILRESVMPWIQRALTFLVVSCPCALVVSVPLSFFGGIGRASREGILIKGANYLEQLAGLSTAVFDKTGTLTEGSFTVTGVHPADGVDADELSGIAAVAEGFSSHPIAKALRRACHEKYGSETAYDVNERAGEGIEATVCGKHVWVGNDKLMKTAGMTAAAQTEVGTVIHVTADGKYLGYIVIADKPKADSKSALAKLKELGVKKTVMLTGDRRAVAESIGKELGVDEIKSELMPADKVSAVEELLADSSASPLAFCGDGINDAPVLSRADIGIAMGALGSDAAIEAADIVLMDDKLTDLARAVEISRKTMRIVWENIILALAVKAIVLVLGATGHAGMWLAVFADVGVLVIAILNAMRTLGYGKKKS